MIMTMKRGGGVRGRGTQKVASPEMEGLGEKPRTKANLRSSLATLNAESSHFERGREADPLFFSFSRSNLQAIFPVTRTIFGEWFCQGTGSQTRENTRRKSAARVGDRRHPLCDRLSARGKRKMGNDEAETVEKRVSMTKR